MTFFAVNRTAWASFRHQLNEDIAEGGVPQWFLVTDGEPMDDLDGSSLELRHVIVVTTDTAYYGTHRDTLLDVSEKCRYFVVGRRENTFQTRELTREAVQNLIKELEPMSPASPPEVTTTTPSLPRPKAHWDLSMFLTDDDKELAVIMDKNAKVMMGKRKRDDEDPHVFQKCIRLIHTFDAQHLVDNPQQWALTNRASMAIMNMSSLKKLLHPFSVAQRMTAYALLYSAATGNGGNGALTPHLRGKT